MPDEFDLWREMGGEILESPDSDSPRLRFAAALENMKDTSDEARIRARFIRVQLRLASLETDHPEWMRLATEALSLILDYEKRWTPALYQKELIRRPEFHRGFVEYITVAAAELLEMRRVIFSDAPIRHLDIVELPDGNFLRRLFDELKEIPYFRNLVSLSLDGQNITNDDVEFLADLPLTSLRWLSLAHNEIADRGVLTLVEKLAHLRFVDLRDNPVDPIEELVFDQGVVTERHLTHWGQDLPHVPWLRRQVISGQLIYPSRFEVNREDRQPILVERQ